MAGRAKENLHGGSLKKYLFICLKIRIFKCSYRTTTTPTTPTTPTTTTTTVTTFKYVEGGPDRKAPEVV